MPITNFYPNLTNFLNESGWGGSEVSFISGDPELRQFYRVKKNEQTAFLMDSPYFSNHEALTDTNYRMQLEYAIQIAYLLEKNEIRVPKIYAHNVAQGFVLLEDLGDNTLKKKIESDCDPIPYCYQAVETLKKVYINFSKQPIPSFIPSLTPINFKHYLSVSYKLFNNFLEWYWPYVLVDKPLLSQKEQFFKVWESVLSRISDKIPQTLTLRNYLTKNIIILPSDQIAITGFHEAVKSSCVFDIVTLLEDIRIDVNPALAKDLFDEYMTLFPKNEHAAFKEMAAILTVARNTKVLGLFACLALCHKKVKYFKYLPRYFHLLRTSLETAPILEPLQKWYEQNIFSHVDKNNLTTFK